VTDDEGERRHGANQFQHDDHPQGDDDTCRRAGHQDRFGAEQGPRIDPLDGGWLDRSGRGNPAHDGSRPGMLCRWRWTT
jgi:hypothetical protein